MSDFKINTGEAIFALMNIQQFSFECLHGNHHALNQEIMEQMAINLPVRKIGPDVYYRARIIDDKDDENTGITRKGGIPITGYDVCYSGVAPKNKITENGRVNHIGEQILYLAEDKETSCRETKADRNTYLSVAECLIDRPIKIVDFTYSVAYGLERIFDEKVLKIFQTSYKIDMRVLYMGLRGYLTAPDYKKTEYIIPLVFLDKLKVRKDISGIKYSSFYTDKCNIALWGENKYLNCINSKVVYSGLK